MNRKLKSEITKHVMLAVLGLVLVGYGYFFAKDNPYLTTLGLAFTLIGVMQSIIYFLNRNNKSLQKNLKLEDEERNIFIRGESGRKSFWITFFFVIVTSNINFFNSLKVSTYGVVIICAMSIIYFTMLGITAKKY